VSSRRDYKLGSGWQHRRRLRLHGLLVLTLVMVGLFGSLLAYVRSKSALETAQSPPAVGQEKAVEAAKPVEPPPAPTTVAFKPKYDFYKVLPERKLVIGNQGAEHPAGKQTQALPPVNLIGRSTAASPAAGTAGKKPEQPEVAGKKTGTYTLHAGSFRDRAEADRRKASLSALGVPARIETVTGADGGKTHRVRIGPVRDANEMKALKRRLQENNISASVKIAE